jgi:hypothetical protein
VKVGGSFLMTVKLDWYPLEIKAIQETMPRLHAEVAKIYGRMWK